MKHRTVLSIALALSVMSMSLLSSNSMARAQNQTKFTWDTGVVTLGPNQMLRITVALGDTGTHEAKVRFRSMEYTQGTCNGGVCAHQVASDTTSAPVTLAASEAASVSILGTTYGGNGRGIVLSNSQDVRVTALIIDTVTGSISSMFLIDDTPLN
jgi:regulator of extracellular matrix RemA (YlzA/DUF370 family)